MEANKTWKVGDLARETGVSVRALHYYEEIELLVPSGRTPAGHRVYGEEDVARLHQVVALRDLGFSLDQVGEMLARPDSSPLSVIQLHIERLRTEASQRQALCDKLESLADMLVRRGQASASDFIEAVRRTTMIEKYYTGEQLDYLARRRAQFSDEEMASVEAEWRDIFARMRAAMDSGVDPSDEPVQQLVARMDELVEMFTGGDASIRASLTELWRNEAEPRQMMGIDSELAAYIERARKIHAAQA